MITCAECGAEQYPGALFCDACGAAIHPAARTYAAPRHETPAARLRVPDKPPAVAAPAPASPPPAAPRALHVRLTHHDAELTLRGVLIHVGRADPEAGFTPELDLTAYGGQERGVSRRHATIRWVEGGYVLVDQHSSNGTWLNGVRLVAGYAYQIPPGAGVRFGGLLVQLTMAD